MDKGDEMALMHRIKDDDGSGWRANPADMGFNLDMGDRGGNGDDEGSNSGGPHSSSGFKRALMRSTRTSGKLSGDIASRKDFGGKNFRKPNYFAQGGQRHGMHVGSGAPFTGAAQDTGAESGGV